MINVDDGVADAEASRLRLGHRKRYGNCGVAGTTTCFDGLRRREANRMAEVALKERNSSSLLTVRKIVKAAYSTQIEMSQRKKGHER
jgi:hypothetical protein